MRIHVLCVALLMSFAVFPLLADATGAPAASQQTEKKPMMRGPHQKLTCTECHGTAEPVTIPRNEACLECHGTMEKLVEKTAKYNLNPHTSPHWGTEVPCAVCHRQHQPSRVLCAPCHTNQNYVIK